MCLSVSTLFDIPFLPQHGHHSLCYSNISEGSQCGKNPPKKQIFSVVLKTKNDSSEFFEKSWNLRSEGCVIKITGFISLFQKSGLLLNGTGFSCVCSQTRVYFGPATAQTMIKDLVQHVCTGWLTRELSRTWHALDSMSYPWAGGIQLPNVMYALLKILYVCLCLWWAKRDLTILGVA